MSIKRIVSDGVSYDQYEHEMKISRIVNQMERSGYVVNKIERVKSPILGGLFGNYITDIYYKERARNTNE